MSRDKVVPITRKVDTRKNIKVNTQRKSMKAILLLFVEPCTAGSTDSEKYSLPDLKKVSITINGSPNIIYNEGIEREDIRSEVSRFFMKEKHKLQHINVKKFYAENNYKFGLLIDLCSMASQEMHDSGKNIVNSTDGIQLNLVPRASFPLTSGRKTRALGATILK